MKKLDKTKVYYLGDLNDEQLLKFAKWYETVRTALQVEGIDLFWLKKYSNKRLFSYYFHEADNEYLWGFGNDKVNDFTNAITLFDKNDRIIEIQLRIQELNNEILELDEELTRLTYEEKV